MIVDSTKRKTQSFIGTGVTRKQKETMRTRKKQFMYIRIEEH